SGPEARVLQFASVSFDAAARDVAVVLTAGATLVVATAAERAEPAILMAMIQRAGVLAASLAPSLLSVLDPGKLTGVTTLFAGSEPVSEKVATTWGPGRRMFIGYGPTETTVISCTARVSPFAVGDPPIGRPVANTRVFVLDRYLRLAPVGVTG